MVEAAQPRIPIAVVGAGWVASHRHLPVLAENRQFVLVGVVDRHAGRAISVAREFGLPRWAACEALRDVGWLNEVRAVTIATAPESHARLMNEARSVGIDVLTEKPFTLAMSDAAELAEPSDTVLAVMHNFQFARSAQRLWADIASDSLGEIRSAEAVQWSSSARRLPEWYEDLPLGLFFDESPHLLYLLRRLAPEIRMETAHVRRSTDGRATPSAVWAMYSSGGSNPFPIALTLNFDASVSEWHFAVHGSKGVGIVDLFRDIYIRIPGDGAHETRDVLRTSLATTVRHWHGFASSGYLHLRKRLRYGVDEVVRRFGDAIVKGEDPPDCGRVDALAVRVMQEEILGYAEPVKRSAMPVVGRDQA
jgi:scyllo-inositol 2-dehydrogenase (NADP+)